MMNQTIAAWVALAVDVVLFVGVHVLVIWRRNHHPLKVRNIVLSLSTVYHKLFTVPWIALRPLDVIRVSCRGMTWTIIGFLAIFLFPYAMEASRIVWIQHLEKQKGISTTESESLKFSCWRLECMRCCRASIHWRLLALAVIVLCPPIFVIPPVVNSTHSTYSEFDFETCVDFDASMMIPFIISFVWALVIVAYAVIRLQSLSDAWGLGRTTSVCLALSFVGFTTFVVLNIAIPEFNSRYFDSGWICWVVSTISTLLQVVRPALQTFWTPQQRPRSVTVSGSSTPGLYRAQAMVSGAGTARSAGAARAAGPVVGFKLTKQSHKSLIFQTILSHYPDVFRQYCANELSGENMLFWQRVEEFRQWARSPACSCLTLIGQIDDIYQVFLSDLPLPDGTVNSQVNLQSTVQIKQNKDIADAKKTVYEFLRRPKSETIRRESELACPNTIISIQPSPTLSPAPTLTTPAEIPPLSLDNHHPASPSPLMTVQNDRKSVNGPDEGGVCAQFACLFDTSQTEIRKLMESDTFPRFLINPDMVKWMNKTLFV